MHSPQKPHNWSFPKLTGAQSDVVLGGIFALGFLGMILGYVALPALGIVAAVCTLLLAYASFVEPRRLSVTRRNVSFPLEKPLRIAIAADFHVGPFKGAKWVAHVVHKINTLKPDLILLPGDFVFDEHALFEDLQPLKDLSAPLGVFAVAGNHDAGHYTDSHGEWLFKEDRTNQLEAFLKTIGITMLRNRAVTLAHGGQSFALAGIDDLWGKSCDLDKTIAEANDLPLILVTHHPDTMLEDLSLRAHLVICGHTHGGQVCLPGGRPLGGVPSVLGKKYAYGSFPFGEKTTLFVSRGCGETLARVRLCCPPEIALLECGTLD